jgi:hypothetical protein
MILRWKKNAAETGLSAVGAAPRGHKLRDSNGKEYAWVSPLGGGWASKLSGWYWVCLIDGHRINTCYEPVPDVATAKADATAFVKKVLKEQAK